MSTSMPVQMLLKDKLPEITDMIVQSYQDLGTINHLGYCPLPSMNEVIEIVEDLKELLYPGYKKRQNLHLGNIEYHVGDLVDSLCERMIIQICRALRHLDMKEGINVCNDGHEHDYENLATRIVVDFFETIPAIRKLLATDVQAAFDGDPAAKGTDEIIFCYPGLEAVTVHRLAHELYKADVPYIPRMMAEWSHARTGIDIHPGAQIGPSFFIDHGTGVVIGETCIIHGNVKIYQGVTLGALSFPKDENGAIIRGAKRHPTIGEGTVIYANATILGGDTHIGAYSVIGASVSLSKSVPASTVVTIDKPSLRFREAS